MNTLGLISKPRRPKKGYSIYVKPKKDTKAKDAAKALKEEEKKAADTIGLDSKK